MKAIQERYPEEFAHCFGCGTANPFGHHIRTYRDGGETRTDFNPQDFHTALPGFVYGGLIASLIDCHSTGSAAIFAALARDLPEDAPAPRFVTAQLQVDYHKPTPLGPLQLRGSQLEISGRKVVVSTQLYAQGQRCASGRVVCVELPPDWGK